MKINLNSTLTNQETKEKTIIKTKAIKNKNKITYMDNNDKYTLLIFPSRLILNRTNNEIESTIYFESGKTLSSNYHIKEQDINLEIDIKTEKLEITDNKINIIYKVIDSSDRYFYKIEMSE